MDNIEAGHSNGTASQRHSATIAESGTHKKDDVLLESVAEQEQHVVLRWLKHDIPYIAMLALALIGVVFRLPVIYWGVLVPVFGILSVAAGWKKFSNRDERLGLVYRQALDWCALLLSLFLLYNGGLQGVLNANATSLAMMTLLALGTFVAGVQARVWQISVVGGALFLAVPGLGWLDQSPMLLAAAAMMIVVLSGLAWWASNKWKAPVS